MSNAAVSDKHENIACQKLPASFRDPAGFVFRHEGVLYRQVNDTYQKEYGQLIESGLYAVLAEKRMIVTHDEVEGPAADSSRVHRIIKPEVVEFVSYPYEWSFSQLKDAALLTLEIQRIALDHGMSLKDASAYNVQFHRGKPIFIDTLSFESYVEGKAWVAYRQFCQHFIAPLALMAKSDVRFGQLARIHIDGVPLDLASAVLPRMTWMNLGLAMHLHLHARTQKAYSETDKDRSERAKKVNISRNGLIGIIESLRGTVSNLEWNPGGTEWGDYYQATNYSDSAFEEKRRQIASFIDEAAPRSLWDLGANTGVFSRIASDRGIPTVAFDIDPAAVEKNYRQVKAQGDHNQLPLVLDLTNPSPGLGWNGDERESLAARGPADCVMALALIHHLAISNNVPLRHIAAFFAKLSRRHLIIEFVPKQDSQVQRLLRSREDIFSEYNGEHFERAFSPWFSKKRAEPIEGTERTLYLMERKAS